MNPMQFFQLVRSGGNPQAILMQMMQSQGGNNPFLKNLMNMAQNHDSKGLEQVARNIAKEKGMDFDKEFSRFRDTFRV